MSSNRDTRREVRQLHRYLQASPFDVPLQVVQKMVKQKGGFFISELVCRMLLSQRASFETP